MGRLRGYFETFGNPVKAVIVMGFAESLPFVGITSLGWVLLKGYDAETLGVPAGSVESAESGGNNDPAEPGRFLDSTDLPGIARGAQAGRAPLTSGLPPGYALDASDPDLLLLLREDGTTAAAFSARGATACGIMEAVERDVHPAPDGWRP